MDIKTYIEDLFKYIDAFENRAADFDTEAFLQTYNGIYAVFQAMREDRDKAIGVDQFFLEWIKKTPLNSSDLRQLVTQVLITYFESEADIDGQSNKSYQYCRDLRPTKRDISYFEGSLVPQLFKDGSLNNNYRLNLFLLKEICRYVNRFGASVQAASLSPEDFGALSDAMKFMELMRRRMVLGETLLSDRGSLEFHLQGVGAFGKLARKNKLHEFYLKEWNYLRQTSRWARFKQAVGQAWGKLRGAFASGRYLRLVLTQRPMAYLVYTALILFWIFMAVYVPLTWKSYAGHKLEEFQNKAATFQSGSGR